MVCNQGRPPNGKRDRAEVVDAKWTPTGNVLTIVCVCGTAHVHPAAKRWLKCQCGRTTDVLMLKIHG
jgi:hypothetical protein